MSMEIEEIMLQALAISKLALPKCRPNPPVGCIVTFNREIIATGYTEEPGKRHAEIVAIDNCGQDLNDCELFVTLEPCSFFGRTPACTDRLIKQRPKKIFVAILDSDPRNNGRGIELLRQANINVEIGLAASAVELFLAPFLNKS